ncbi:MAG: hypothetical protein ACLP3C_09685, partial [Mycobacterium sp.]|uniref:hypothetical protein n=1 Tax=Mycobacterium sp. TaxID=1785 RepID=UPI003F9E2843
KPADHHDSSPRLQRAVLTMPSFGNLVPCTEGGWMILPPQRCPNGHRLGPNLVLVGHQPCAGNCHGGHTTWECLSCNAITYAPGVGAGCRLLDAAAFKR